MTQGKERWIVGWGAFVFISLTVLVGLKLGRWQILSKSNQTPLSASATARVQPHLKANSLAPSKSDDALKNTKLENTKLENTKLENTKLENTKRKNTREDSHQSQNDEISYETLALPKSIVHVVRIPPQSPVMIRPAAAEGLERLEVFAQQSGAIAAINGGFFDPNNERTTSYVTIDGSAVLNPLDNPGLMGNFNVAIYIDRILNRSEFRRYQCNTADGKQVDYAITPHDQLTPFNCKLLDALGAGPALLPEFRGEDEAFVDATNGRDALGSNTPNARSGIGLAPDGTVVLVMAAQRADVSDRSGLSLFELADIMASLGVEQGLNLDGGSSSALYYDGTTHYGRLDANNNVIRRSVKSVLLVLPTEP